MPEVDRIKFDLDKVDLVYYSNLRDQEEYNSAQKNLEEEIVTVSDEIKTLNETQELAFCRMANLMKYDSIAKEIVQYETVSDQDILVAEMEAKIEAAGTELNELKSDLDSREQKISEILQTIESLKK